MKILFINSYLFISYLFNFIDIENTLFYFLIMQIFEICFLVRVVVFVFVCLVLFFWQQWALPWNFIFGNCWRWMWVFSDRIGICSYHVLRILTIRDTFLVETLSSSRNTTEQTDQVLLQAPSAGLVDLKFTITLGSSFPM